MGNPKSIYLTYFKKTIFLFIIIFCYSKIYSQEEGIPSNNEESYRVEYYKYWNPYRRVLELRGKPESFYGQIYYQVDYNKDNRVKSVTKFGKERQPQETYHFIWSRSGIR